MSGKPRPASRPKTFPPKVRHRDKYRSMVVGLNDRGHRRADGTLKRPYPEEQAKKAVADMQERDRKQAIHAYLCGSCGQWHLGSTGQR